MSSFKKYIALCSTARIQDAGTRTAMRDIVLPVLKREEESLRDCREQCGTNPAWKADWESAGMVSDEQEIARAIKIAEKRLSEFRLGLDQIDMFAG